MPENDNASEPREFATFLLETNKGRSHDELSRALRELVAAVDETDKGGTLTYKISVKPESDGVMSVSDEITLKAPQHDRPRSIFFTTEDHDLVRNDPRQLSFDQEVNR